MQAVALYLKALRDAKGLTQAEAAKLADLNPKTVERWEAGTNEPRFSQLGRYVEQLNGSLAEVAGLLVDTADVDQNTVDAASLLSRLNPSQRRLITELARELLHEQHP